MLWLQNLEQYIIVMTECDTWYQTVVTLEWHVS